MDKFLETLPQIIAAIGALGVAAAALVDALKSLPGGGPSLIGFRFLKAVVDGCLPAGGGAAAQRDILLGTIKGNWINGMPLAAQKAVASSLVKLYMAPADSAQVANYLGVPGPSVNSVASLWRNGPAVAPNVDPSPAIVGRVDLALTAVIDGAYQHADQRYRNISRLLAGLVAVVISLLTAVGMWGATDLGHLGVALLCGLVAVPLAPIAKDLTSALQAGVKLAQTLRR